MLPEYGYSQQLTQCRRNNPVNFNWGILLIINTCITATCCGFFKNPPRGNVKYPTKIPH